MHMDKFTQNIVKGTITVIGYCHGINCFGNENTHICMHNMRVCFGGVFFFHLKKKVVKIGGVISNYIKQGFFFYFNLKIDCYFMTR